MSEPRVRSKTGCLTCKNRRKKCDETRPVCQRCKRAGMECLGYSYLDNPIHKPRKPRTKRHTPAEAEPPPVVDPSLQSLAGSWTQVVPENVPSYLAPDALRNDSTPFGETWASLPNPLELDFVSTFNGPSDLSFLPGRPTSTQLDTQLVWSDTGLGPLDAVSQPVYGRVGRNPDVSSYRNPSVPLLPESFQNAGCLISHQPNATMVRHRDPAIGEVDLFQPFFSLGDSQTETSASSSATSQASPSCHTSAWLSPALEGDDSSATSDEDSDTEGVISSLGPTLTLDRNVSSNALPFVISSYLRWITRTVFEPLKIARQARDKVIRRFTQSDESRCGTTLVAIIMELLIKNPALGFAHFPAMKMLERRVYHRLFLVKSTQEPLPDSHAADVLAVLHDVHEMIAVKCLTSPLSHVMTIFYEVTPVYRMACSEPIGAPIHLHKQLIHSEVVLRHYPAMDILFSLNTCRPMLLRYDVTDISDVPEQLLQAEDLGLQWMNGIPDRFLVMLAHMHMLREDFAPNVDPRIIKELETDIGIFRPVLDESPDSYLKVARLMVQESWRQVMYIYLYMGLCGATSHDTRVQKALKKFIRLLDGIKPGRNPDIFLIFPMTAAGVAACKSRDRDIIRRRILGIQECNQVGTSGNDAVRTLDGLWAAVDVQVRPAVWSDLRIASSQVTGII